MYQMQPTSPLTTVPVPVTISTLSFDPQTAEDESAVAGEYIEAEPAVPLQLVPQTGKSGEGRKLFSLGSKSAPQAAAANAAGTPCPDTWVPTFAQPYGENGECQTLDAQAQSDIYETISEIPELQSIIAHTPTNPTDVLPSLDLFGNRVKEETERAERAAQRKVKPSSVRGGNNAATADGGGALMGGFDGGMGDDMGMDGLNLVQLRLAEMSNQSGANAPQLSFNPVAGAQPMQDFALMSPDQYLSADMSGLTGGTIPDVIGFNRPGDTILNGDTVLDFSQPIALQRPTYKVAKQDTLDDLAVLIYGNSKVGHLIADLNAEQMDEVWRNGTRIVVLRSGQTVHLPVNTEIQDYLISPLANQLDELVTVVIDDRAPYIR